MSEHRTALRWLVGLLVAGAIAVAGVAPAQADTGWNGTTARLHHHLPSPMKPADTGWNGT